MRKPLPFGKYLLLDRVAVGGMAEVFAAKYFGVEGFERLVAIKRILPTMVEDDEFVAMFLDEARIAARLNHATVAQVYELGRHEETYYIAMEYVSGRDVRLIIDKFRKRNEAVPLPLAAYIIARVSEGLDYAHSRLDENGEHLHIIHRDISPQNILVSYDGEVKLIDFGIAKAAGRNQKTQVGILKGKFAYMSPEQVRGSDIDHRSDLYSVGVMLYEMVTGVKLFSGESDFSTLEKVRAGTVRAPSELNPEIPAELERVVLKALAKDRTDRYQSGAEICDDLMRYLYQAHSVFSSKSLARFMGETFVEEQRKETERLRRWWLTTADETADFESSAGKQQKVRIGAAEDVDETAAAAGDRTVVGAATDSVEAPRESEDATAILRESDISGSPVVLKSPTTPPPLPIPPPQRRSGAGRAFGVAALIVILALGGAIAFVQLAMPGGVRGLFAPKLRPVVVDVTPDEGAAVEIDGAPQSGPNPLVIRLAPGTHHLRVSAPHYLTTERSFAVPDESTLKIHLDPEPAAPVVPAIPTPPPTVAANPPPTPPPTPPPAHEQPATEKRRGASNERVAHAGAERPPPPAPPPPPAAPPPQPVVAESGTASLTLDTDPPGALAKVEGRMGHTPLTLNDLNAGRTVPVLFVMRGYERKQISVTLEPGQDMTVSEKLVPTGNEAPSDTGTAAPATPPPAEAGGVVDVLCFPASRVLIDGKETSYRTSSHSTKIPLIVGHHSVSCESDTGQTSQPLEFDLLAGQSIPYRRRVQ